MRRRLESFLASPPAVVLVLALAAALRFGKAGEWSLWEDEETSIYFSQNLDRAFPSFFPIFFAALRGLYRVTGVSVGAGRYFVATLGVLSLGLGYFCVRRLCDHAVALLTTLFLTLSLGHLFWSQSIRYYVLVFSLQLLALYWFFRGFEDDRPGDLVLANGALWLALLTHFSAALVMPVFVAHLILVPWVGEGGRAGYRRTNYLAFGVPFLLLSAWFAWRVGEFRSTLGGALGALVGGASQSLRGWTFLKIAAYFGVPLIALALGAPVLARRHARPRLPLFLSLVGFLPIVEIVVMDALRMYPTWYYAFFAVAGLAALAALTIVCLDRRGWRGLALVLGLGSIAYELFFVQAYFTTMHGDRPRWKEASMALRARMTLGDRGGGRGRIFASVPGVVAYYLGVPPGETMGHPLVQPIPRPRPAAEPPDEQWYVVEASIVPEGYGRWFADRCVLEGRYEAKTGPKDRSVLIYHYSPRGRVAARARRRHAGHESGAVLAGSARPVGVGGGRSIRESAAHPASIPKRGTL